MKKNKLINFGSSIKALPEGKIEGYLVLYSGPEDPDLAGDYFTEETNFGDAVESAVYYAHGQDPELGLKKLTDGILKRDNIGVWIQAQLDLSDKYQEAIYNLAQDGKLGWSSGTATHLVERKYMKKGVSWIKSWPLGLDASITPVPCEPRTISHTAIKEVDFEKFYNSIGLDNSEKLFESQEDYEEFHSLLSKLIDKEGIFVDSDEDNDYYLEINSTPYSYNGEDVLFGQAESAKDEFTTMWRVLSAPYHRYHQIGMAIPAFLTSGAAGYMLGRKIAKETKGWAGMVMRANRVLEGASFTLRYPKQTASYLALPHVLGLATGTAIGIAHGRSKKDVKSFKSVKGIRESFYSSFSNLPVHVSDTHVYHAEIKCVSKSTKAIKSIVLTKDDVIIDLETLENAIITSLPAAQAAAEGMREATSLPLEAILPTEAGYEVFHSILTNDHNEDGFLVDSDADNDYRLNLYVSDYTLEPEDLDEEKSLFGSPFQNGFGPSYQFNTYHKIYTLGKTMGAALTGGAIGYWMFHPSHDDEYYANQQRSRTKAVPSFLMGMFDGAVSPLGIGRSFGIDIPTYGVFKPASIGFGIGAAAALAYGHYRHKRSLSQKDMASLFQSFSSKNDTLPVYATEGKIYHIEIKCFPKNKKDAVKTIPIDRSIVPSPQFFGAYSNSAYQLGKIVQSGLLVAGGVAAGMFVRKKIIEKDNKKALYYDEAPLVTLAEQFESCLSDLDALTIRLEDIKELRTNRSKPFNDSNLEKINTLQNKLNSLVKQEKIVVDEEIKDILNEFGEF